MYKKILLDNGIKVVTNNIPHVKSVSIGIWIKAGSIYEDINSNGISHFLEHMLFKGTYNRSASEIASEIDGIGGQLNAFTSKECTCYYAKVLDSHIDLAIDILSDMILNSKFDENNIEKEKGVVFEEIGMYEDSPDELVYDILSKETFKNHSLGLPILGTINTVKKITRQDLIDYVKNYYCTENIVISVAGSFDEDSLIKTLNTKFGRKIFAPSQKNLITKPKFHSNISYRFKDIEQTHICISHEGVPNDDNQIYPLLVLNNVLGGSMSSRLFQTIREEHGLAYSIYSHPSFYRNTGLFTMYVSINPIYFEKVIDLISNEIHKLLNYLITEEELYKSKEQLKGNYILGLESTSSIMSMMGKSEVLEKRIKTPEEILKKIDAVNMNNIEEMIKKIFKTDLLSMSIVGKADENKIEKNFYNLKQLYKK